jgi:hypothetical protein
MQGGLKQVLYKEYICWIQVKIHISDQTSLRICNSVGPSERFAAYSLSCCCCSPGYCGAAVGPMAAPLVAAPLVAAPPVAAAPMDHSPLQLLP